MNDRFDFELFILRESGCTNDILKSIATRFVAFAMGEGNPNNMRIGSVNVDPPPARVFIKPAATPARKV